MAQSTLTRIMDEIRTLMPEELLQVRQVLDAQLEKPEQGAAMERFHRALLETGLVKEIKPPRTTPLAERRLIQVCGKPVSETIIEERR